MAKGIWNGIIPVDIRKGLEKSYFRELEILATKNKYRQKIIMEVIRGKGIKNVNFEVWCESIAQSHHKDNTIILKSKHFCKFCNQKYI